MGHERVPETMEVSAIAHFLSEYVGRIDFLGHMLDLESLSRTHSRTDFSLSSMCRAALEVML